jgi:hypothetical protein
LLGAQFVERMLLETEGKSLRAVATDEAAMERTR